MIRPRSVLGTFSSYAVLEEELAVKLDANEAAWDLPGAVKEKVVERVRELAFNRYPQISALGLRQKIAAEFGLSEKNVLAGNGSSQLLAALCYTFADGERSVVYHRPTFSMYDIYARLAESRGVGVDTSEDFLPDRDAILAAAKNENAGIILLCNPNNPTGTVIPADDIEYIAAHASCPVVVDEAYQEFYGLSSLELLKKYSHVAIARTFSKAYGLASVRTGYLLGSEELIAAVAKTIMPYNLNALAIITAETALEMKEYFAERIARTVSERKKMADTLAALPEVKVFPSETNFLLIKMTGKDPAETGNRLYKYLLDQEISVRNFSNAPFLAGCLRITIGTAEENLACAAAIKKFKEQKI